MMNLRKIVSSVLIGAMFCAPSAAWAETHHVNAEGMYVLASTDTMDQAKEKALREAMRSAVEKAGVYVESYSVDKNMSLTQDEVRVIAGSIIKVSGKRFETVAQGESFVVRCYITADVDTDEINLKRAMEMKKTAEDNVRLKKSVGELQTENQSLRTQYEQSKDDNEKMRIQNELLSNEQALGMLYQNDYQGTVVLAEIRDVTADMDSLKRAYVEMPSQEFWAQVHPSLLRDGWSFKNYNGNFSYTRQLDDTFEEQLAFPMMKNAVNLEDVFFTTSSKVAADKVYRIAFVNLYKSLGKPTIAYDADTSEANWHQLDGQGKEKLLGLSERKSDGKYRVTIARQAWNRQNVVHRQESSMEEVRLSLAKNDGDWYDDAGKKVLSIHDGSINDCPVVAGFDFAGGRGQYGTYRIQQADGPRDITIERLSEGSIKVDKSTVLRSTPTEQFFESVNGVHLGMNEAAVRQALGVPDRKETGIWYYDTAGLQIVFGNGKVIEIRMLNNGNWFLRRSGLNYRNSIADFRAAYHLARTPSVLTSEERAEGMIGGAVKIAKDEYLWFDYYPDVMKLSIFWN